ncbi:hypothetical protein AB1282_19770 [Gottfriedia sp. S16(2024)]|uniref:hypothetical protein n=1 Tax=Gottfriedia sp. S16(2024) TaxID=3162883 RepID=UPI003D2587C9
MYYEDDDIYLFLRYATGIVAMLFFVSSIPLNILDHILSILFGDENVLLVKHHNWIEIHWIKSVLNYIVGIFSIILIFGLGKKVYVKSQEIDSSLSTLFLVISGIYLFAVSWLVLSFIFGNGYGMFAFICSLFLFVIPFLTLKVLKNFY